MANEPKKLTAKGLAFKAELEAAATEAAQRAADMAKAEALLTRFVVIETKPDRPTWILNVLATNGKNMECKPGVKVRTLTKEHAVGMVAGDAHFKHKRKLQIMPALEFAYYTGIAITE